MNVPGSDRCHAGVPGVPVTALCDQDPYSPEDWVTPPNVCIPVIPSGLFITGRDFDGATPPILDAPSPDYRESFDFTPGSTRTSRSLTIPLPQIKFRLRLAWIQTIIRYYWT